MSAAEDATAPQPAWAALRHRGFALLWGARLAAAFATQVVSVAIGWRVYDLTRDPFDLGIVGLVQFAPALLLVLVTGTVADRYNRRVIVAVCLAAEALCAAALLVLALRDHTSVLLIFCVLFVFGIARAFLNPAQQSLIPNLVPAEALASAIALTSSTSQFAVIVGPVAGGLLYGVGAPVPFAVGAALFGLAVVFAALIPKPPQKTVHQPATWSTVVAGFRYIWHEKVVLGAISLDLFAVLLGGAVALLPAYARDILEVGPWGLGLLRAAPGVGALVVAAWLAVRPVRDHAGLVMFACVALFGVFDPGLRPFDHGLAVGRRAGAGRRRRHGQRLRPRDPDPVVDAGCRSRPRQRRQHGLRRRVQRARRVPRRHRRRADRRRPGSGHGCRRHRWRRRSVDGSVPPAPQDPPPLRPRLGPAWQCGDVTCRRSAMHSEM